MQQLRGLTVYLNRLDTDYIVILQSENAFNLFYDMDKPISSFHFGRKKAQLPIYNYEELINVITIGEGRLPEEPVIPFTKEENDIFLIKVKYIVPQWKHIKPFLIGRSAPAFQNILKDLMVK